MPEDNHGIQGVIVQMRTNALSGLGRRSLSLSREAGSEFESLHSGRDRLR